VTNMTVQQLIEALSKVPADAEVRIGFGESDEIFADAPVDTTHYNAADNTFTLEEREGEGW